LGDRNHGAARAGDRRPGLPRSTRARQTERPHRAAILLPDRTQSAVRRLSRLAVALCRHWLRLRQCAGAAEPAGAAGGCHTHRRGGVRVLGAVVAVRRCHPMRRPGGIPLAPLAASALMVVGAPAIADHCEKACKTETAACIRDRCTGLTAQARSDCLETCRGIGGCTAIRTLAY